MKRWPGLSLLVVALSLPCASRAQDAEPQAPNSLEAGAYSITFRLPEAGTGSIGIWRMLSDQTNLGVLFDLGIRSHRLDGSTTDRTERRQRFAVEPIVKYYVRSDRKVAPFAFGSAFVTYHRSGTEESDSETSVAGHSMHAGVSGGGGAEWFPVRQVSIGGRVGLQLGITDGIENLGEDRNESALFAQTFTTNLVLRIFF